MTEPERAGRLRTTIGARTAELELSLAENEKIHRELGESDEKLRLLSEHAFAAIILADAEGNITYWNSSAERMFGHTRSEILGRNVHVTITPERSREKAAAGFAHFAKTGLGDVLGRTLEMEALHKDGSEFPIELSVSGVRIKDVWHSIAVINDITERKRLTAEMEYRSRLLHAVSVAAKELLTAPAIETAMALVLKTVGEAARVDRMIVFENQTAPAATPARNLRFTWNSPQARATFDDAAIANADASGDPWFAPLNQGLVVSALPNSMPDGPAKSIFVRLGIAAIFFLSP